MASVNKGQFVWYEDMTKDPGEAIAFYSDVVGWKTEPFQGSDYTMWVSQQGPLGGVMKAQEESAKAPASWLAHVQVDDVGATVEQGAPFPEGTTMVMDLFAAQKDAGGTLLTNDEGALLKGDLLKIFVMGKQPGWGQYAESGLQNGDWMYAAYAADGLTELTDPVATCFGCHLPLGESKDWVQRYDEYFQARAGHASAGLTR